MYNNYAFLLFCYSIHQENVNETSEDDAPLPVVTEATETADDISKTPLPSPVNEESVVQTQDTTEQETDIPTADCDPKSSSTTSNLKETNENNKESVLKDSTDKTTSESSTNKPATSSKTKASRDKNGGGVTGSRVTSKSHISGSESGGNSGGTSRKPAPNSQASLAGNYILEPDPKVK